MSGEHLSGFAAQLRALRSKAGEPSLRTLEAAVHYSRTTLSEAFSGKVLPSLPVTLAMVSYLDGDLAEWEQLWQAAKAALEAPADPYFHVASALPPQLVQDGADPEAAGCHDDARTVHARKIRLVGRNAILGQVELRYSPSQQAAWGRFLGYDSLKHLAHRHHVEVLVGIERAPDGARMSIRDEYWFDYHWCDLLVTGRGVFTALATLFLDGAESGSAESDGLPLA